MTKEYHLFRLSFKRTLHLGKGTDFYDRSDTVLHSDTLYAAITAIAVQIGMNAAGLPEFALTSAFPFVRHEDRFEYFFPRIVLPEIEYSDGDSVPRKTLKNLRWLTQTAFEKSISRGGFPSFEKLKDHISQGFLFEQKAMPGSLPFTKKVNQRVKVSRIEGEDALPFYVETLFFKEDCGFFVLAECSKQSADWLEGIFKILGSNGLGTDRNVGYGQFDVQRDTMIIRLPDKIDGITNLSLYLPKDTGELGKLLQPSQLHMHRLVERGGWISTEPFQTLRKHSITMIEEGGMFHPISEEPIVLGRTIDVKPEGRGIDHPVLRSGKAIFIPISLGQSN